MGTVAEKLAAILESKAALKAAFEAEGLTVPTKLSEWPDLVGELADTVADTVAGGVLYEGYELTYHSETGLSVIIAPNSTTVSAWWLHQNPDLRLIALPSLVMADVGMFQGLDKLKRVELGSLSEIPAGFFADLPSLVEVTGLWAVGTIGSGSDGTGGFSNCPKLQSVQFMGLEHVGDYAFADDVSLRNTGGFYCVSEIGDYAFENCRSLETENGTLWLEALTSIGSHAFAGCDQVRKVYIGNCSTVDAEAFAGMGNLEEIHTTNTSLFTSEHIGDCWGCDSGKCGVFIDV